MPQIGQPPRPEVAAFIYPVSFEARLGEARTRRAVAISQHATVKHVLPERHPASWEQTFEENAVRPADAPARWTMPSVEPTLFIASQALARVLHWFERLAGRDERVRWTASRTRAGALALVLGFAAGVLVASAALVTAPASFWKWAAGIQPALRATVSQPIGRFPMVAFEPAILPEVAAIPMEIPVSGMLPTAPVLTAAAPDRSSESPLALAAPVPAQTEALAAIAAPQVPTFAAVPVEIPVPGGLPAPRGVIAAARGKAPETSALTGPAPTQAEALPAIAAMPIPAFAAGGLEMPSDRSPGSFAPQRIRAVPAEGYTPLTIALPVGDPAGLELARITAPAPPDPASVPVRVSAPLPSVPVPAAVSTEAARLDAQPTLRLAMALPESREHLSVASLTGDPALSDGGDYPLYAVPAQKPARVSPSSEPKAARTSTVRPLRAPQVERAGRNAVAGQVKRATLENAVEGLLRDRLLRK